MSDNREINTSGAAIKAKKRKIAHEAIAAYIFVSIPLIGYLFFNVFPIDISFCMQFNSMTGLDLSTMKWNNFENFKRVFTMKRIAALTLTAVLCFGALTACRQGYHAVRTALENAE